MNTKIGILGGGTWGTTLGHLLSLREMDVAIWEYNPEVASHLDKHRSLKTLPGLSLSRDVLVTNNIEAALRGRRTLLSVTPSHTVRSTFREAVKKGAIEKDALIISASKGLEEKTHATMMAVIEEECGGAADVAVLAGPSHAEEVALGHPVALVSASSKSSLAETVQQLFSSEKVRTYTSADPLGVELGGALKNIYALACGIADGLALGDNTKAAIMTRGLLEMTRLGAAMGAKTLTFFGLSGLGDMIVTCNSHHSRNRRLGEKIGQGKTLSQALSEMTMVAEGVKTTQAAYELARIKEIDVPIINEMHQVLFENKLPKDSLKDLMGRQIKAEMEGIQL